MQIQSDVGVGPFGQATNLAADQVLVINLLDAVDPDQGGTRPETDGASRNWTGPQDGWCSDELAEAITTFQLRQDLYADGQGVVTPDSWTFARLEELAGLADPAPDPWATPEALPAGPVLRLWCNAFIPSVVDGVTVTLPDGTGRTAVPGPFAGISDCFLTDQRGFSDGHHATSRVHVEISFDLGDGQELSRDQHCDESIEVDCEDGDEEGRARGTVDGTGWTTPVLDAGQNFRLELQAAANNPLFTGSPDIDVEGSVVIDPTNRTLAFSGKIDEFPAFECYLTVDDGPATTVFQISPEPGRTPADLPGSANRPVDVTVSF